MSTLTSERLYNLLPAIYRQRDVERGSPLQALLAVMEQELVGIEQELGGLYDDWFIETCQEWVVPYMGDLFAVSGSGGETSHLFSQRGHVANAIAYRRRKGLPAILERVAQDMTGWNARAVEYFNLLARTQHLHNVRRSGRTFDLRDRAAIAQINRPFEKAAHLVDVRRITTQRGKHNIPNVGLFLWRLPAFPITRSEPFAVENKTNCYTFHPLGVDMALFNQPQPKHELTERTEVRHVAALLTRQLLKNDLERHRAGQESVYFGEEPAFQIWDSETEILPDEIWVADLSDWEAITSPPSACNTCKVALDPELGRFKFFNEPSEVRVSYAYGFSANIGGGPYDRRDTLAVVSQDSWVAVVSKDYQEGNGKFNDLQAAIDAFDAQQQPAIIQITDNSTYDLTDLSIDLSLSGQQSLVIEAADGMRPCLVGGVTVTADGAACQLALNGLLIGGGISLDGSLNLTINHCTLTVEPEPESAPAIQLVETPSKGHEALQITISHSLLGPLHLPPEMAQLTIQDCVIDGKAGSAIADAEGSDYGPPTSLERVTVFGTVKVTQLTASETIFTELVEVQQRQVGYLRFSYVPAGSQTPQHYRCQPDLAVENDAIRPRFTATNYGQPGYAQLSQQCALELTTGAENGAEMGAFQHLLQPQRAANLKASLDEYLPIGLEAGIFYVT